MLRRLLAILCLSLIAYAKTPRPLASVPIHTTDPKKNIDLKKYRGKILMVILFLTDCPECVNMLNFAGKLENEFGPRGFQVIGAAVDEKAPYLIGPFTQRYKPNFPIGYLNKQDEIVHLLDYAPDASPAAPILFFVDHVSTVRFQYTGRDTAVFGANNDNLRLIVANLLRQRDEHKEANRVVTPAK